MCMFLDERCDYCKELCLFFNKKMQLFIFKDVTKFKSKRRDCSKNFLRSINSSCPRFSESKITNLIGNKMVKINSSKKLFCYKFLENVQMKHYQQKIVVCSYSCVFSR